MERIFEGRIEMIFISHKSNPDHELALYFKDLLNKYNVHSWIAPESVPVGQSFAETIPQAIRMCEKVLLILTPETLYSKHVAKEIDFVIRYNKEIVPVQMRDCKLSDEFDYLLSNVQIRIWNENTKDEIINELISSAPVFEIEIKKSPSKKLILMRGDFQNNLDHAIKNSIINPTRTIVVAGIDRFSDLYISSKKGILRDLCKYIESEYNYGLTQMQQLVNQAKIDQLNHPDANQKMNYGDSILIKIPLFSDHDMKPMSPESNPHSFLQLLLVANSQKKSDFAVTHDLDSVEGIDSREIILHVFNRCMSLGSIADTVFIGAMGTNGLSFPYEVITAEIMNSYLYAVKMGSSPNNLVYSVRNEDMKKSGVTSQSIYNYVRNVVNFF